MGLGCRAAVAHRQQGGRVELLCEAEAVRPALALEQLAEAHGGTLLLGVAGRVR